MENLMMMEENNNLIVDLTSGSQISYCSINTENKEDQLKLLNMTMNCEDRLADHINEVIEIANVYVEIVTVSNKQTGEISSAPRIILIDSKGHGTQCVSFGIYNILKKMFLNPAIGTPDLWESPLKFKVKQRPTSNGFKILTLEYVGK